MRLDDGVLSHREVARGNPDTHFLRTQKALECAPIFIDQGLPLNFSAVELFGYCASALIAYSLTRDSIVKLRWFNLFGASSFCIYGIIIGALPVALLNGFIAMTNVVFLRRMFLNAEQHFSIIQVSLPSNYVEFFLNYHQDEINQLFPRFFKQAHKMGREYYFMMENTEVVGILSGFTMEDGRFMVDFDFVIPAYRDCKLGEFVMGSGQHLQKLTQYTDIVAKADSVEHESYLSRIGYSPKRNGVWSYDPQ